MTRFVALACFVALFALPSTANAETTGDKVGNAQSAVDAVAQRWFDAQRAAADTNARVSRIEKDIADAEQRVAAARTSAAERARVMYQNASLAYAYVMGTDSIDVARRANLIEGANAENMAAIDELTASLGELKAQQKDLDEAKRRQEKALQSVADERAALEKELSVLRAQADREAQTAAEQAARAQQRPAADTSPANAAPTRPNGGPPPTTPKTTPGNGGGTGGGGGGGGGSHHDDPFLSCTRARESRGIYTVVSSDGLYYGAYQFLRSTWDTVAAHAGRRDLIGVTPSQASVADQDEMAWALYQWQGKGPWGGRC